MKRLLRRLFTPTILAAAPTAVVFAAAFIISWESLRVLAISSGIRELLAPLYPATIDSLMVTGTVAVTALRTAPVRVRLYAWTLIAAAIAVSVLGNAVHSQAHGGVLQLPGWAAAAASAVPALSLAASLHLFVLVLRHRRSDETSNVAPQTEPAVVTETRSLAAHEETPNGRRAARRNETRRAPGRRGGRKDSQRRIWRLIRSHPDVTAAEAAKRLGLSRSHAGRLLGAARKELGAAEERKPHVLEAER